MTTRVLVVDDSPTIRKVVGAVLAKHGFEALHAADGQQALERLSRADATGGSAVDLVLVDFVMPKMNGFQFCRALRQDPALRGTPVVLMSAKSDRIREHFVQQTGAIDAITKPFDAQALIAVIENAVRRSAGWRTREPVNSVPEEPDPGESPLQSSPPEGVVRAALTGDLSIIPIGAALQMLQLELQTGVLLVTDGTTEVTIALHRGLIDLVQARGAGTEFRLGRYFVEHGIVTAAEIENLIREATSLRRSPDDTPSDVTMPTEEPPSARRLLGELLVESGKVTRDQLRVALAQQSSELVYAILRWTRGRFEFRREPLPALAELAKLGLPVASLVMEGFRRVDEWRLMEAGLGSFDAVLQVDPVALDSVGGSRLAKPEQRMLEILDGQRTVRELIEKSNMSSFDACRVLFQLIEARLVRRRLAG